ncbi:MAG: hypothetical protein IJ673_03885 [Treponema sp.]|nr:hypothetical protein [Treponema sp.]
MAKIEQSWEPGTLDKTRKNLGVLSEEEAKKMMKVLGGEVLQEKSAPIDYKSLPQNKIYAKKAVGKSANAGSAASAQQIATASAKPKVKKLPDINAKERQLFDKLMMDSEYKIKTSYGIFNFVLKFTKSNEKLRRGFVEFDLEKDLEHLNEFIMAVKSIIQIAPASYKERIMLDEDERFVFIRLVGGWTLKDLRYYLNAIKAHPDNATVLTMSDFIKATYRMLLKIYYLGENRIPAIFKDIYNELVKYPKIDKRKVTAMTKSGIAEWFYVYKKVVKGLYPILMRLCCKHCEEFHDFFIVRTADILGFLEMTKYDLMLPNHKAKKQEEKKEEKKEEAEQKQEEKKEEAPQVSPYVKSGLKLLEQLFPQAGFSKLETHPDMYPYFQPLYQFREGLNLLSPENPLQVTIILLRITEDFLQGCRTADLTFPDEDENDDMDKISTILNEWALYREVLFERNYASVIKEFSNNEFSNPGDFRKSQYGLKLITDMLWETKYYFLPYFNFQQVILDKPKNDNPYRQLCVRATILRKYLQSTVRKIAAAEKQKGIVEGVGNPWAKYKYGIQTPVSKRLNVILGAKKPEGESRATNANLLKYTLCVIAVLEWWLNDKASPAYSYGDSKLYRVSEADGAPEFSVPLMQNQNDLFMESLKSAIAKKSDDAEKQAN